MISPAWSAAGGGAGWFTTITKPACVCSDRSIIQPARGPPPGRLPTPVSGEWPAKPRMKLDARSRAISFALSNSQKKHACVGRVVRKFADGFAVKFAEKQRRDDLVRLVVRSAVPQLA